MTRPIHPSHAEGQFTRAEARRAIAAVCGSPSFRHLQQPPIDCEHLFQVSPPVVSPAGLSASHVVAGIPMESWVGPDYGIQVFAADAEGRVVDWDPIWDSHEGIDLSPSDWPTDWLDIVCAAFVLKT